MSAKKPAVSAVVGVVAGTLVSGGAAAVEYDRPLVAGAQYGERVRFRCERDRGFLAIARLPLERGNEGTAA